MAYIYDIADTWAASGTTFTGIKLNVTDSASAAGSLLMDLQVGGSSKFRVAKTGDIYFSSASGSDTRISGSASNYGGFALFEGATQIGLYSRIGLGVQASASIGIGALGGTSNGDTLLWRDAANTFGQRNGVNAQAFNLYNTYTDASNYERGFMRFVGNVLQIGSDKLGTGTGRNMEFHTNGINRMQILSDGSVKVMSNYFYNHGSGAVGIWASTTTPYIGNESNHPLGFRTNNAERVALDTVGSVRITTALTVATLPATPLVGMMARVTDATTPTVGSTVTGGGAAAALCWYNGANWKVIGV